MNLKQLNCPTSEWSRCPSPKAKRNRKLNIRSHQRALWYLLQGTTAYFTHSTPPALSTIVLSGLHEVIVILLGSYTVHTHSFNTVLYRLNPDGVLLVTGLGVQVDWVVLRRVQLQVKFTHTY